MDLLFLDTGAYTTIQDLGRWGMQAEGFSPSGAMDLFAFKSANLLVGNEIDEACIEMTLMGAKIKFEIDAIIAITGADMEPKIKGQRVSLWKTLKVNEGDILELGKAITGFRTYLSIKGGFDVPIVFGSKSTTPREKVGGIDGRPVTKGDSIPVKETTLEDIDFIELKKEYIPKYNDQIKRIRVLKGPYEENFTEEGIQTFYHSIYEVSNHVDRTGYRLLGEKIKHRKDAGRMISGGMVTGAIQVPGDGNPIVLTAERRTHGGYPIIATVISVDIPIISQSGPGDKIRFVETDMSIALRDLKKEAMFFEKFKEYSDSLNEKLFNIADLYENDLINIIFE